MLNRLYLAYMRSRTVCTDSRAVSQGCVFFALRGEHFDGGTFVPDALNAGAALCVVDDERYVVDNRCVVVDDVLRTLQDLAAMHRSRISIPVVGITGTNGKTTTKELVHAVLSRRYRTAATEGNHNNHLGVPLTLLSIPADAEMAVVEMGANHPGEIADLCRIADPDVGIITNVGRAHLEGFGSFGGVVRTKTELYRHLAGKHGLAFVDADNATLMDEAAKLATIPPTETSIPAYAPATPILTGSAIANTPLGVLTYGRQSDADFRGTLLSGVPYLKFYFEVADQVYTVQTHLIGGYNFANCMAAVAVGLHFGVEPFDIKEALECYTPQNQRSQWKHGVRNDLYLDCYNANPSSMEAALRSFAKIDGRKAAVIGGMRELGSDSAEEHRRLLERIEGCGIERVVLVGSEFDGLRLPTGFELYHTTESACEALRSRPIEGCTVLVKGSNGNRLWQLEEVLL